MRSASRGLQVQLPFSEPVGEDPRFLSEQLITYIGNKRALLSPIEAAVRDVCSRQGKSRLRILDAFSGSGSVSRLLKRYARELVVNDLEDYCAVVSRCFLANSEDVPRTEIAAAVDRLNRLAEQLPSRPIGFLERLYAPQDQHEITSADRVFYTKENARRLDLYRQGIENEDVQLRDFLLGPLLSEASIHANTAGVFKGFYKSRHTGVGQFGGSGRDALSRITAPIGLCVPILSQYSSHVEVLQTDANMLPDLRAGFDLVYLDPPYNQHPYGSNYFMLNLLANYIEPKDISKVSGIPIDWRRSRYNQRQYALSSLKDLIYRIDTKYFLISYSDEGFISISEMRELLSLIGKVEERALPYATFRGSRNLRNRNIQVTEHLFLVERG